MTVTAVLEVTATSASAQRSARTTSYKVRKGDTLELIAAEFYGNRRHRIFIMVENGIKHKRPLKRGQRLRIPTSWVVTANVGDTLAGLAEEHLDDERRAPFLALYNGLKLDASIAVGQSIEIPFHVTHVAARKVRLRQIALAYFQDKKKAKLLKAYNFLDKDRLEKGEEILIPILTVRVRATKQPRPDKESEVRMARRADMQTRAERALKQASAAWASGDYREVKRKLIKINTSYLDEDYATDIGVLLGSAYIAFEDLDSAIAEFEEVVRRNSRHTLSSFDYSPKIRAVWKQVGGLVDSKSRK